jgi:hypothetical protein
MDKTDGSDQENGSGAPNASSSGCSDRIRAKYKDADELAAIMHSLQPGVSSTSSKACPPPPLFFCVFTLKSG